MMNLKKKVRIKMKRYVSKFKEIENKNITIRDFLKENPGFKKGKARNVWKLFSNRASAFLFAKNLTEKEGLSIIEETPTDFTSVSKFPTGITKIFVYNGPNGYTAVDIKII